MAEPIRPTPSNPTRTFLELPSALTLTRRLRSSHKRTQQRCLAPSARSAPPTARVLTTPGAARPASGTRSVERILTSVVLPAPFGPSNPNTAPGAVTRYTPASATVEPKCLATPATRIAGADGGAVTTIDTPTLARPQQRTIHRAHTRGGLAAVPRRRAGSSLDPAKPIKRGADKKAA